MTSKHMANHTRPIACQYPGCIVTKAGNKDMIRHAWNAHSAWAEEIGLDRIDGTCPGCGTYFTRADNMRQHQEGNKCRPASG